jgi:hypothetical protein
LPKSCHPFPTVSFHLKYNDWALTDNTIIQGLWIGPVLSTLERLSIASFLANGHAFHLYAYDEIEGLPKGASLVPADAILPRSRIFRYKESGSYAGFANLFRYKLLLDKGGWWTDLDTVCLRRFDFPEEYVFSSEVDRGVEVVDAAAIKAPAGSALAEYAFQVSGSKDPERLGWGETGPRLLGQAVERFHLQPYVQPSATFCPIPWPDWDAALRPGGDSRIVPETFAVHLWNEVWRRNNHDKDAAYPPDCLFERLKAKYLGSNMAE